MRCLPIILLGLHAIGTSSTRSQFLSAVLRSAAPLADNFTRNISTLSDGNKDERARLGDTNANMPCVLIVLIHGNNAGPEDWESVEVSLRSLFSGAQEVFIFRSSVNAHNTHAGINVLGRRVADEINKETKKLLPRKPYLSVIGHSLGGLVARSALGYLYEEGILQTSVVPGVYMSLCSPHLGVRAPKWSTRALINFAGVRGKTEKQLLFQDKRKTKGPVLAAMARPDGVSMNALKLFKVRFAIGMANYDSLVPAASACLAVNTRQQGDSGVKGNWSYREIEPQESALHEPLHQDWTSPKDNAHGWITDVSGELRALQFPEIVLQGLNTLSWQRMLIVAPATRFARKTAHDFPINKKQPSSVVGMSQQCVSMLTQMLVNHIKDGF